MFIKDIPHIKEKIRDYLDNKVLSGVGPEIEAARYVVLNENAHLWRPLITVASARDYEILFDNVKTVASAVELVHAASLIEDDISDESELRRGKPSCHIRFGEDLAHLAQMYLVQRAYNILLDPGFDSSLTDARRVSITRLASELGIKMISGQTRDVTQTELDRPEKVIKMYEQKSGVLIGLAIASGAIIEDAYHCDVETLVKLGTAMGVSYQIVDDALDSRASVVETGKPTKQDTKKTTLLNLVGWDGVINIKREKDNEIDRYLGMLSVEPRCLREMAIYLRERHKEYL